MLAGNFPPILNSDCCNFRALFPLVPCYVPTTISYSFSTIKKCRLWIADGLCVMMLSFFSERGTMLGMCTAFSPQLFFLYTLLLNLNN